MKTFLLLLSFTLVACSQGDSNSDSHLLPASTEGPVSVMDGFDAADPEGSFQALAAGVSDSKVIFETYDMDLKEVYQDEKIPLAFPFQVDGNDPVLITGLESSCGCTDVFIEVEGKPYVLNDSIPAGTKGIVRATFTSAKYRKDKNSVITLRGNAANFPEKLTLHAFVRPVFEYEPSQLRFGDVMSGDLQAEAPSLTVSVVAREPFEVLHWKRLPEGVTIQDTGRVETGANGTEQHRWFEVTLGKDLNPGVLYQSAIATTSLGNTLEVVLHANVLGPVKYYPEQRLWFGTVNQGQTPVRVLKVVATLDDKPLVLPEVSFEGAEVFSLVLAEKKPGKEFVVRVKLSTDAPLGRHGGKLKLHYPEGSGLDDHEILVSAIVRSAT